MKNRNLKPCPFCESIDLDIESEGTGEPNEKQERKKAKRTESRPPTCWKCGMTMRKERMQFETRRYKRFYKCECGAETSHFGLWTIAKRAAMEIKNYYDSVKISNK